MKSVEFCYWLQGYFELSQATGCGLSADQRVCIEKHLALVFKHEIDPSAGPPEHQAELDAIHSPKPPHDPFAPVGPNPFGGVKYRC